MRDTPTIRTLMKEAESVPGFSRATVSMVVTNPQLDDNPIVYVNDAFERMTGYNRSAVIGRNCRFLQGDETDPGDVARLRDCVAANEEVAVDILNYRANGEPFMNRLVISPILGEDGKVAYFFGVQKELTKEDRSAAAVRADEQMKAIQRRVKHHLSMVIELIRAQSQASMASDELSAPREFAALARRIEALQFLYEELLMGKKGVTDTVGLGTYLSRVANSIAHEEGRRGVRCSIDIEPFEAPIEVAARLGMVFSEVLTNAFQHAFVGLEQGLVDVRMSKLSEGGVRLTIADDGLGIPQKLSWPARITHGGRIVDGMIEGLGGTLILGRGAAGTIVTIDVPVGASAED